MRDALSTTQLCFLGISPSEGDRSHWQAYFPAVLGCSQAACWMGEKDLAPLPRIGLLPSSISISILPSLPCPLSLYFCPLPHIYLFLLFIMFPAFSLSFSSFTLCLPPFLHCHCLFLIFANFQLSATLPLSVLLYISVSVSSLILLASSLFLTTSPHPYQCFVGAPPQQTISPEILVSGFAPGRTQPKTHFLPRNTPICF